MTRKENVNAYNKNYVAQKRAKGLCRQCHELAVSGKAMCQKHLDIRNFQEKQRRNKRIKMGLCVNCGTPAEPGKTKCKKHLKVQAQITHKHILNRREIKFCTRCKNPAEEGFRLCSYHRAITNKDRKEKRDERIVEGFCFCGNPLVYGFNRCQKCLDRNRADHFNTWRNKAYGGNRKLALERDNYTCQICGKDDHVNCIHHIDGAGSTSEIQNNDLDNLITVCKSCHRAITVLARAGSKTDLAIHLLQRLQDNKK